MKKEIYKTIKIGEKIKFSFHKHTSVGEEAEYINSNPKVLEYITTEIVYNHPDKMKDPRISGADSAIGSFIFQAKKRGNATITIIKLFREEEENRENYLIKII